MVSYAGVGNPAGASNIALGGVDIEFLQPLERAAGAGDADATKTLLAAGTTVPIGANAAEGRPLRRAILHWAAFGGNPNVVTAVLEAVASAARAGVEVGSQAAAGAAAAAAATSAALRARCLSRAGGPNGTRPLHLAAEHGHVAAAIILLEAGAVDTHVDGSLEPPLALAVRAGHDLVVTELLRRGSLGINDSLAKRETVIHPAAEEGHVGMVVKFLREGAAVNVVRRQYDETPLHLAVRCGLNAETVTVALLAAGADVDPLNEIGHSALCMASDAGVIRALVAAGADLYSQAEFSSSPIDIAIGSDDVEQLSAFLELGVEPNHRGPFYVPSCYQPDPDDNSEDERLAHEMWRGRRLPFGGAPLLHLAAQLLGVGAVEMLLAAGAREDIPATKYIHHENSREISSLPIDAIGLGVHRKVPEFQRRANAIRGMLAGAHLYRKGWLSVLRARFGAGESLTGNGVGGEHSGAGGGSDGVEGPSPRRQKGEGDGSGSNAVGVIAVEHEAWYRAAVWIARVPGPEVFRIITEYL